jgi:hypothetical protein
MYLLGSDHILPVLHEKLSFLHLLTHLFVPSVLFNLTLFEFLFENLANLFAELTCYADREFYKDWWNASNFSEYSRNWNRPVHLFLLKHIYQEVMQRHNFGKTQATFLTFFFSAICHEFIMFLIVR